MIKSAFRHLNKHRGFTFINVAGLALAMSASLIIFGYVFQEWSYDSFHNDKSKIYRVLMEHVSNGGSFQTHATTYSPIPKRMFEDFSGIEDYLRLNQEPGLFTYNNGNNLIMHNEENVYYASSSFFNFFSFPLALGNKSDALKSPNEAFVSESIATKYFGNAHPIGKTLKKDNDLIYTIVGVFKDIPTNSHITIDILLPYSAYASIEQDGHVDTNWDWWGYYLSYIKLKDGVSPNSIEGMLPDFMLKYKGDTWKKRGYRLDLLLQPLNRIHFETDLTGELASVVDERNLYVLLLIGVFIITIAWINYVNLTSSNAFLRIKEVGIRKVLGSSRHRLILQFLTEAIIINSIAMLIAVILSIISLPFFNNMLDTPVNHEFMFDPVFLIIVFVSFSLGGFVSGISPALFLSAHGPIQALKGKTLQGKGSTLRKQFLVIFQFSCTTFLTICTIGIYQQVLHIKNQNPGFDIEQNLVIKGPSQRDSLYDQKIKTFSQELLTIPQIREFTSSSTVPGTPPEFLIGGVHRIAAPENVNQYRLSYIDENFLGVYGLEILAGRNLSEQISTDTEATLINETARRLLGFSTNDEAIGQKIQIPRGIVTIRGVIKDYYNQSSKLKFKPTLFRFRQEGFKFHHTIKLETTKAGLALNQIEGLWKKEFPNSPFDYFFLDNYYNRQYESDQNFGEIFGLFSVLAVLIACLGLYALASFTVAQKRKEFGIRKVLGASPRSIMSVQYYSFLTKAIIALLLASPIAIFFIKNWLLNFENKINLNLTPVLFSGLFVILITILTVTHVIIKATKVNPVKVLKHE